jgi:hypothetical protein
MPHPILRYANYIFWHKWYVFVECAKRGILWRGLIHDWSKILPSEFVPYYKHFYGGAGQENRAAFDLAWLLHVSRNKHHWQFWILPCDEDGTGAPTGMKVHEMPEKYRKEMLADWIGAGKAQGSTGVEFWWGRNKRKVVLGQATRDWLEREIVSCIEEEMPRHRED